MLRQHGHHLPRKIHRVAARLRFNIQRIIGFHIKTHIGNRHNQAKAASAVRLAVHRIVKITRRFAVDGYQRQAAQIEPPFAIARAHIGRIFCRELFDLRREHMRQRVFAQCNFDFHTGVAVIAQHFHHARHRLAVPCGLRDQFNRDHLPCFGIAGLIGRHHEFLTDAFVFGHHEVDAMTALQTAHVAGFRTFQNFGDFAFGPAASIHAGYACHHTVAVQHLAHFIWA